MLATVVALNSEARREREIDVSSHREANRADARTSAEKEPGNHSWDGRSARASVDCWACRALYSLGSLYDSDHLADLIRACETPAARSCRGGWHGTKAYVQGGCVRPSRRPRPEVAEHGRAGRHHR